MPELAAVEPDLVAFLREGLELGAVSGLRFFVTADDAGTVFSAGGAEDVFWHATTLATEGVAFGGTDGSGIDDVGGTGVNDGAMVDGGAADDVGGTVVAGAGASEVKGLDVGAEEERTDVAVGS